jgi:predicted dehydrogenase
LRVALAGLGGAATRGHLPAIDQLAARDEVELVGAADPDARCRAAFAAVRPHVPVFERTDAMLTEAEVELLVVATEPNSHAPLTVLGLERGLRVLCEKPLTLSGEQYAAIARVCRRRPDAALVPVHQYRYSPAWLPVMRWGRRAHRCDVPFSLAVELERPRPDPNAASPWRADPADSGGLLADHAVHFLALAWAVGRGLEAMGGSQSPSAGGQRCAASAKLGSGRLEISMQRGGRRRRTRIELRLAGFAYSWTDATVSLALRGQRLASRRVEALSDRGHVDSLYLPLYRDLLDHGSDPTWLNVHQAEALGVGAALLDLLAMAAR